MAPWELAERPLYWRNWARLAEKAESEAIKQKQTAARRKAGAQ